jgi:class 3 adenylate cyclase
MADKNPDLQWLEKLKLKANEIHAEQESVISKIRGGFVDRAIVFMDVVGSTKFKVDNVSKPELWILRVKQFSDLMAAAVKDCKGHVVKFIGDEVMASFENIYDAQNLVGRISEIENNLKNATGFETRIKVAVDFGLVYELSFPDHNVHDPQGTPVDRCARLAKFSLPGEVISSASFAAKTPGLKWVKVGTTELKGLGQQTVFQYLHSTADIEPRIELLSKDYNALNAELDELRMDNPRLKEQNKQLQQQLKDAGEQPSPDASFEDESEDKAWKPVQDAIDELNKIIKGAPGSPQKYARFVFMCQSGEGLVEYNALKDQVFDELIESSIVTEEEQGFYKLVTNHPRNKKVMEKLKLVDKALGLYLRDNDQNPDDLFNWDLNDSGFWSNNIGWYVL